MKGTASCQGWCGPTCSGGRRQLELARPALCMQLLHGDAEAVQAVYHVVHHCVMQACQLQGAARRKVSCADIASIGGCWNPSKRLAGSNIVKGPGLAVDGGVHGLW